jgi:hypothetical protein
MRSLILALHIGSGTMGMLSGYAAMFFRKGSRRHGLSGDVFVVSMLVLSATGIWLATLKSEPGNILGGALTFYLVATGWMSANRGNSGTGLFDWVALMGISSIAGVQLTFGVQAALSPTGLKYDYPAWPYFFLGSVALLAALGDVRMLERGSIVGPKRVARHLWRMCFAWFIASASIFTARQERFPAVLRETGVLALLSYLPLLLMVFWFVRVRYIESAAARRENREQALHVGRAPEHNVLAASNLISSGARRTAV